MIDAAIELADKMDTPPADRRRQLTPVDIRIDLGRRHSITAWRERFDARLNGENPGPIPGRMKAS
jgi:hypothetical protein